jgi:hypothetical protein
MLNRISLESASIAEMGWSVHTTQIDSDITESENLTGFLWLVDGVRFKLAIPDWFLAAVFGMFAAVPALFPSKWRFSLRTLLIAITAIAVMLGLIVWALR